jgi:peptidyl-prolyl cis-trans isomerase B (cyclophilin B)
VKVEVPQAPATNLDGEVDERIQRLVASGFPTLDDANAASFLSEWGQEQTENRVVMETKHGAIVVELFDDVPVHRANFLYKVHRRYFDPAEFTRVVPDFVVQGGNSEEERPQQLRFLIGQHTLPSEFQTHRLHTRGALAMSRSYHDNPDKRSSGYDFYIVTGRKIGAQELARVQHDRDWSYTKEQSKAYASLGGAPHLDGEHTVFGRVVTGMEVVDRLAATPRDASDWPVERLEVTMQWEGESP